MTRMGDHLAAETHLYGQQAADAARAEAAHKSARAKRFLRAMHSGEAKSAAMAENIADADDVVADLLSKRLIAAAVADATKERIRSMREEMASLRTQSVNEREADREHARSAT